jgi:hypothetical protein
MPQEAQPGVALAGFIREAAPRSVVPSIWGASPARLRPLKNRGIERLPGGKEVLTREGRRRCLVIGGISFRVFHDDGTIAGHLDGGAEA